LAQRAAEEARRTEAGIKRAEEERRKVVEQN
jgi:hypothetical protein